MIGEMGQVRRGGRLASLRCYGQLMQGTLLEGSLDDELG